ncbi:hypothetical protein GMDG_08307 [Pseudogymnoascus destructans 20631-21]|uniref:Helicase C-terminal domain-containing protein n=2 Tax=Pseudogymnoascus destructans TaxID=655981 RepID=L8G1P0_PSED2|nr:hypothetical protein GMDG_08307 [Pseudogymnoascus destructans 20631-21]
MSSAEAAEYQFFHQSFVKDYEEGLEIWANQKQSRIDPTAEVKSFPCITGPLRAMTVNAVSTILSRFHDTLDNTKVRKKRLDDTVATISILRAQGFTGLQLAHATVRKGDRVIKDAADLIHHLTFVSPKMRWILKYVMDHCLKRRPDGGRNKLLCSEDIPVSAWFIETVLKSIYIRAEVLHAGLNDLQRIALIQEFNEPQSDLVVLVMMYQVSSQGANLDGACHRVCSVTTAINLPSELQVHYRPIRVSQKEKVTIVQLSVVNSHNAWRETKQVDKSIIDVLTKLRSPESFQVIADALNDNRDEMLAAHNSDEERDSGSSDDEGPAQGASFTPVNRNLRKRKRTQQETDDTDEGPDDLPPAYETPDATYSPTKHETDEESENCDDVSNEDGDDEDEGVTPNEYISDFRKA